mmetsp:Transcript_18850/g.33158  ORF Transcript_18850/g.33158 Transcript_18850/m.33158 type:complete len:210 (+) Transcript_18850:7653-8282(+)
MVDHLWRGRGSTLFIAVLHELPIAVPRDDTNCGPHNLHPHYRHLVHLSTPASWGQGHKDALAFEVEFVGIQAHDFAPGLRWPMQGSACKANSVAGSLNRIAPDPVRVHFVLLWEHQLLQLQLHKVRCVVLLLPVKRREPSASVGGEQGSGGTSAEKLWRDARLLCGCVPNSGRDLHHCIGFEGQDLGVLEGRVQELHTLHCVQAVALHG